MQSCIQRFSILNGSWVTSTRRKSGCPCQRQKFQYPQRIVGDFNPVLLSDDAATVAFQYPQRIVGDFNGDVVALCFPLDKCFSILNGSWVTSTFSACASAFLRRRGFSILNGSWVTSTLASNEDVYGGEKFQYPQRIVGDFNSFASSAASL